MHQRLDLFNSIPYKRFSINRTVGLRFCVFNGSGQFLLYDSQVNKSAKSKVWRGEDFIFYFNSRMLHWTSSIVKTLISLGSFLFFINHFVYLSVGSFDYSYNMKANIITGKTITLSYGYEQNILIFISVLFRYCNGNWLGNLVHFSTQDEALRMENSALPNFNSHITLARG